MFTLSKKCLGKVNTASLCHKQRFLTGGFRTPGRPKQDFRGYEMRFLMVRVCMFLDELFFSETRFMKSCKCYYSQASISELRTTGTPAIRHKTCRNGFLPTHFTPSIRKPRCPTPTWELKNGYVKSIEENTKPDYANCYLLIC